MNNDSTLYMTALSMMKSVGPNAARKLISAAGSAKKVFELKNQHLANYKIPSKIFQELKQIQTLRLAENEISFTEKNNIQIITFYDSTYPYRLKQCIDSPLVLYKKGNGVIEGKHVLAVVGTRNATNYGRSVCEKLIEGLKCLDITVVSGLALGIDGVAHKSAISNNINTVAVLGHDLTKTYPHQHIELSEKIVENGSLLTEFSRSFIYNKGNFPSRNRIIAGLADATVVVESAVKGGSLITADIANSYDRDVFAFSGRCNDEYSKGCNALIKSQGAALIEDAVDLIQLMGWDVENKQVNRQIDLFESLEKSEKEIADIIKENDHVHLEKLLSLSGLNISALSNVLLQLEFKNVVSSLPGKLYSIKA